MYVREVGFRAMGHNLMWSCVGQEVVSTSPMTYNYDSLKGRERMVKQLQE